MSTSSLITTGYLRVSSIGPDPRHLVWIRIFGSVPLTNGSGSVRKSPVTFRIQKIYFFIFFNVLSSVADPDPGSGAFLTPGSGIRNMFFADPGSRIPNPYFWELSENFLSKNFNNSLKIGPNFFLQHFKNKIRYNFVKFVTTKKVW